MVATNGFSVKTERDHVPLTSGASGSGSRGWRTGRWGELATLEYGRVLQGYRDCSGPYRVFGTNGPIGWHTEAHCEHASVIVGRKGAYRGIHFSPGPFSVIDTAFFLKPTVEMDTRWAYYALLTQDINRMDSGSAIPSTSREDFYQLPVSVPPIADQQAIAHILGRLDDKIELNRRMNETLEAMAQALFEDWFVDFEPVRAKADPANAQLPLNMFDLFPDGYDDSPLGNVPHGWTVVALTDLVDINPKRPSLRKGEIAPYVPMSAMPTLGHTPSEVSERPFGSGTRFINGDTLLARITPCLENGKTAYIDFLKDGQVAWGSTEYIVLRPKSFLPSEFAYCLARSSGFREFAIQSMTGTSGRQRVQPTSLGQFLLPYPPARVGTEFGRLIRPLIGRARMSADESRRLADLRDALLPRLISGELRVPYAERIAATVV